MDDTRVYEPAEDSYLLSNEVRKLAFGDVLDMGCGTGIQGICALETDVVDRKVKSVTFADINSKALSVAALNVKNIIDKERDRFIDKKIFFIHTDLFSSVRKKYDTIIFNPPYLPEDEYDDAKIITTGGKSGHELSARFLIAAIDHLKENGIILIVISTLTGKRKFESIARDFYRIKVLSTENQFMEKLYVYSMTMLKIMKGHRGIVIRDKKIIKGSILDVAIKRPLMIDGKKYYDAISEARYLQKLNAFGIGPKFYSVDKKKNSLTMEFITGERINDYFANPKAAKNHIVQTIKAILNQLLIMDRLKINKFELTNPYKHIMIKDETYEPVMIDFERCHETLKPKNITQFIQYLCSANVINLLEKKNLVINKDELTSIARNYKHDDKNVVGKILKSIQ